MKRVGVLVSGGGTNLQALIDAKSRGEIPQGELALVVSSKADAFAVKRAETAGIPACVLSPRDFKSREDYGYALLEKLKSNNIELVVLAGFMHILSEEFCNSFENAIINVHPALIPAFSGEGFYGLRVHRAALSYGVKLTGATVHFVTARADEGPIIAQKAVPVLPDDTPESLQKRVMEQAEWELLPQAVADFCTGRLNVRGRVVAVRGQGS